MRELLSLARTHRDYQEPLVFHSTWQKDLFLFCFHLLQERSPLNALSPIPSGAGAPLPAPSTAFVFFCRLCFAPLVPLMASPMAIATGAAVSSLSPPPVTAERPIPQGRHLFRRSRPHRLHSARRCGLSPAPRVAKAAPEAKADPLNVMIAGAPASGKGTQCELIKVKYGLVHISAGDLLRVEIAAGTDNGKQAKEFMERGQLVPDGIVVNMVKERLLQPDAQEKGWLLDGYPRSYSQAMALETLGIRPDIFILLDVPDELLVERVVGRRLDPVTGKIYHLKYSPPENEEIASRLTQRFDDTEEKVKLRLQTHYQNIESLLSIFEDDIVKVRGDRTVEDVFAEIDKLLASSLDKKTEMVASA